MARKTKTQTPCRCAAYSVLINTRLGDDGNVVWDDELTTGCPGTLTTRTFAPGHDAKLKGFLIRAGVAGHEVTDDQGISCTADAMAGRYGFAHMVRQGIENAKFAAQEKSDKRRVRQMKAEQRNDRENEKAARKLAKAETTHDGNSARQARELAALVEAEEAKFAAEQAAQAEARPEPEWDDEPQAEVTFIPLPEQIELVEAKVGRWVKLGEVIEVDGKRWFRYQDRKGNQQTTDKFTLV